MKIEITAKDYNVSDRLKELIENMQESRHVPKNKGLFSVNA